MRVKTQMRRAVNWLRQGHHGTASRHEWWAVLLVVTALVVIYQLFIRWWLDAQLYTMMNQFFNVESLDYGELNRLGYLQDFIHAVVSHGYGICSDVEPVKYMEKVLFAVDELTGLIGAAALMRPTGISDMETKSVVKKFKDKKFAAGCSRDVIRKGAEMLEMELNELISRTLEAMRV